AAGRLLLAGAVAGRGPGTRAQAAEQRPATVVEVVTQGPPAMLARSVGAAPATGAGVAGRPRGVDPRAGRLAELARIVAVEPVRHDPRGQRRQRHEVHHAGALLAEEILVGKVAAQRGWS